MTETEIKSELRGWIARKNGKVAVDDLTDTTPIVERRVLSSLHVAELLVYIARLRARPVDIESLRPGAFRDVETIYRVFFGGSSDG